METPTNRVCAQKHSPVLSYPHLIVTQRSFQLRLSDYGCGIVHLGVLQGSHPGCLHDGLAMVNEVVPTRLIPRQNRSSRF